MTRLLRFAAFLLALTLCACSQPPELDPLPQDAIILAFGDSVTYGTGAGPNEDYPHLLAQMTGFTVINAGVPGDTAARARTRIAPTLERTQPDLVILELGGNDFLARHGADQVASHLREIISAVHQRGIPVVLVSVPAFSPLRATLGNLQDSPIYTQLGEELELVVIEDLFADILSDNTLRADPIHPNARGYQRLAAGIHAALMKAGLLRE